MKPRFFFHPGAAFYDFGPGHPLQPGRLARTMKLMRAMGLFEYMPVEEPPLATEDELLRCHSTDYLHAVLRASASGVGKARYGLGLGDTPAFGGMWEASLAYVGGSAAAARSVAEDGGKAINITGGLHHAHRDQASGFCVFNDCGIALSILRERYSKVAYVDIDLHHGDGVQWLFYDDPAVLTYSVHQDGRTLFPGSGAVSEMGRGDGLGASVNVPLPPHTPDALWLKAIEETLPLAFELFQPEAVVLQMGTDPHYLDPLGFLDCTAQGWLQAVRLVLGFSLPTVALGGGGYEPTTVPRMWTLACAEIARFDLPEDAPQEIAQELGMSHFFDTLRPPREEEWLGRLTGEVADIIQTVQAGPLTELRRSSG